MNSDLRFKKNKGLINRTTLNNVNRIYYINREEDGLWEIDDITDGYMEGKYLIIECKQEAVMEIHALNLEHIAIDRISKY